LLLSVHTCAFELVCVFFHAAPRCCKSLHGAAEMAAGCTSLWPCVRAHTHIHAPPQLRTRAARVPSRSCSSRSLAKGARLHMHEHSHLRVHHISRLVRLLLAFVLDPAACVCSKIACASARAVCVCVGVGGAVRRSRLRARARARLWAILLVCYRFNHLADGDVDVVPMRDVNVVLHSSTLHPCRQRKSRAMRTARMERRMRGAV
jgi:hypothetical protein